MEILQYWTVPSQAQRTTTPSFAKKWRVKYNYWRKSSQLVLTISQQNGFKQVEKQKSLLFRQSTTRSVGMKITNPVDPVLQHHTSQERQPAAVPELPNNQLRQPSKVMLRIILNRFKLQAKIIGEEETGFRTGRRILCENHLQRPMSSYTSRRPLTGFGMQLYGQPWRNTLVPTFSESSNTSLIGSPVQSVLRAT